MTDRRSFLSFLITAPLVVNRIDALPPRARRRASVRHKLPKGAEVFCDGRSITKVTYADEGARIVVAYAVDQHGNLALPPRRVVMRGTVIIVFPDDPPQWRPRS